MNHLNKSSHLKHYLAGLVLVLFVLVVYIPSLSIYIRGDDFEWLGESYAGLTNPLTLLHTINHFFRPLVKVSYLLNYALFKENIFFYNALTLLLHLITVYLLYIWMRRYLKRTTPAVIIALCFGISSYYSEVTLWSAGRPDSILMVFMLAAILALDKIPPPPPVQWRAHLGVMVFAFLAMGSKETWILLPILAFLYLWTAKQYSFVQSMKTTLPLFILLALYIGYFILLPLVTGHTSPTAYAGLTPASAANKLGFLLFKYVGLGDLFSGSLLQYLILLVLVVGVALRFLQTHNRLGLFGLQWMFITLAISLPIQYAPSRYNYLPLIGFWIMVVALLDHEINLLIRKYNIKKLWPAVVIGLALCYYTGYHAIMLQWEIKDYRRWGETHQTVVRMYEEVKDQLPIQQPLVFINMGTRKAVLEAADAVQGHRKLLFVRESAIWQQMTIQTLDSFVGHPFRQYLEPVPPDKLEQTLKEEFTPLVFTDNGFYVSEAHRQQIREFFEQYRKLPFRVEALQWLKR